MMPALRALSALLSYPSAELKAHVSELRAILDGERAFSRAVRKRLRPLLDTVESTDLLQLQSTYCELFDHSRALSLHLFEHVHGDSRERGQALIDLNQEYLAREFFIDVAELPDFLPLFLEFASCLAANEAREWVAQPSHVLLTLEQRLLEKESPYAAAFTALLAFAGRPAEAVAASIAAERARHEEPGVDESWEEPPVNFGVPPPRRQAPNIIARCSADGDALT